MHEIEGGVDLGERHGVGDHRVDLDLAVHVPVDDPGHVGAPARAPEGGALPHPAGHELERPGGNLGTRGGDADDDRLAPAAVRGFERLAHYGDIAGAIECVIGAADLVGGADNTFDCTGNVAVM